MVVGMVDFYAHSLPAPAEWEPLEVHLNNVASRAAEFADRFGAAEWGRLAGLWHDLGKYSDAFQNYLLTANGLEAALEQNSKVDHSTAGARHSNNTLPTWGKLLAYVIAGHHAGLADAVGSTSSLEVRLDENQRTIEPIPSAPSELLNPGVTVDLPPLEFQPNAAGFQIAFFTRMLFSCLVDADFLATEQFMDPDRAANRPAITSPFAAMQTALQRDLDGKASPHRSGTVHRCRQKVLAACRRAAVIPKNMFSLTVPTGGGKTLSSLAFAIDHAIHFGKKRIVYAIPFTSIIEQTVGVFREVFSDLSDEIVLEHHSNIDPDSKNETRRSRLAAENWDAPLVVTTNVQLFESLFAARTSRCRKLHNLVDSVIILDEAQMLPVDRLRPCLAVLEELCRNYGCTVVLCTATQPAIEFQDDFPIGLRDVHEIIPERERLYRDMKRVTVRQLGKLTDDELVDRLTEHESFLTIVNTKSHAAKLYRELVERGGKDDDIYHLSTLMCGQHRAETIQEIRRRLHGEQPCRVISTQLIEAGVDVDFPVVYRAVTGIDSIAQAAGRCNREGRQKSATVFVFEPADVRLFGDLKSVAQTASEIIPDFEDLLDPAAVHKYFELHYWKQEGDNKWDKTPERGVMNCFPEGSNLQYQFRTAAERFRLIEETGPTIFVPHGEHGQPLIEQLRKNGPNRFLLRQLQRYTVTLYEQVFRAMATDIEFLRDQYPALANPSNYDKKLGLRIDRPGYMDPTALYI